MHFGTKQAAVCFVSESRLVVVVPRQRKKDSQVSAGVVRDGIASDDALTFGTEPSRSGGKGRPRRSR